MASVAPAAGRVRVLITFAQRHEDFRLAELDALLTMAGLEPGPSSSVYSTEDYSPISPYLVAEFPSEEAAVAVCDRAILIKSMIKVNHTPTYWMAHSLPLHTANVSQA